MRTLLAFIFVSIVVLGVGPWLFFSALTGKSLEPVASATLRLCQLFIFTPLCIVLVFTGLQEFRRHNKSKRKAL